MKLLSVLTMAAFGLGIVSGDTLAELKPLHAHASVVILATPDEVWKVVREFGDLGWHPAVAATTLRPGSSQQPGAVRKILLRDGAELMEELLSIDEANRTQTYTILESPLPVTDYRCAIVVSASGNGQAQVTWESYFEPRAGAVRNAGDAQRLGADIAAIYAAGLDNLKKRLEGKW